MELLFVLLLLAWLASQLFARSSAPDERERSSSPDERSDRPVADREEPPSFREAVREIETQLSGSHPGDPPTEQHHHWEGRGPRSSERSAGEQSGSQSGKPRSKRPTRTHRESSTRETTGERSPAEEISIAPAIRKQSTRDRDSSRQVRRSVHRKLQSHRARREIFLLKELIDPPRSQRPWRP